MKIIAARILLVIIMFALMPSGLANAIGSSLEQQIKQNFYQAIGRRDCIMVKEVGLYQEQCLKIHDVSVIGFSSKVSLKDSFWVMLIIEFKKYQSSENFLGSVKLVKSGNKWVIDESSPTNGQEGITVIDNNSFQQPRYKARVYENYESEEVVNPSPQLDTQIHDWNESVPSSSDLTFGSSDILNRCWTPKQLRGNSWDKRVRRPLKNPYRGSPMITKPHQNSPVEPRLRDSIRRIIPYNNEKIVALTFDLCERTKEKTGYDASIVNYLRKHRIKATFYAGGKWMHSHPDKAMQLMADPLFEIGNHAWTHGNMRVLRGRAMENQILWTQGQYEVLRERLERKCPAPVREMNKIPHLPLTFRFPYGTCNANSLQALADYGLPAIQWDVVTGDPSRKQSANSIAKTVLRNVKPGSIIIAHANGRGYNTAKALPLFIPKLRRQGYTFVTVSELLKSGKVITVETCYELKPGDNKKYDRLFGKGTE